MPTVPDLVFELRNVSKTFGSQAVLRDVSLHLRRGETLAVIGESGCGKSVLLKLLMNLIQPDRGDLLWEGQLVRKKSPRLIARERLRWGFLFQGAALFDSLTVFENVAFGLRENRRLKESEIRDIVIARLRDVGLKDSTAPQMPASLSGGMKKRVALARALALDPEVMLYDEPTTGLDPIMSDVINELILRTAAERKVTSLVVTHDMVTVKKAANRVLMLYPLSRLAATESQVVYHGPPTDLADNLDRRVRQFVRGEAGDRLREQFAESHAA